MGSFEGKESLEATKAMFPVLTAAANTMAVNIIQDLRTLPGIEVKGPLEAIEGGSGIIHSRVKNESDSEPYQSFVIVEGKLVVAHVYDSEQSRTEQVYKNDHGKLRIINTTGDLRLDCNGVNAPMRLIRRIPVADKAFIEAVFLPSFKGETPGFQFAETRFIKIAPEQYIYSSSDSDEFMGEDGFIPLDIVLERVLHPMKPSLS